MAHALLLLALGAGMAVSGAAADSPESIASLQAAAEKGDADKQYELGFRHEFGTGVPKDPAEAMRWYRRAAEKQHAGAQFGIGDLYFEGNGVPRDCAEAAKWFRLSAREDFRAQYHLGVLHATGCGVARDDAEAVRWYRLAADSWHDDAQLNLGFMYYAGRGVARDIAQAAKWFRRASGRLHTARLSLTGTTFASGQDLERGLPRDPVLAYFWWSAAKGEGDTQVQRYLDSAQRQLSPAQIAEAGQLLSAWQKAAARTLDDWVFLLGTPDPAVSAEAETHVRTAGPEAVPLLTAALGTAVGGRRLVALCEEVRRMGPAAREAVPALEALLKSRPPGDIYRPFVIGALARIDPGRGKAHAAELERCSLDEKSWQTWVRLGCLFALDDIESPSVPTRIALLRDPEADMRAVAARGLRKAPAAQVRGPLEKTLRDPVLDVRVRAASSLAQAAPDAFAAAVPALLEGLCTGTGYDADVAADAFGDVPRDVARNAADKLAGLLSDPKCQTWAAIALGRIDAARAVPSLALLRKALGSEDGVLRRGAAWTLGGMGPLAREALPDLEEAARKDPNLAFSRDRLKTPPPGLAGLRLQEVRLVGLGKRDGVSVAYLVHDTGTSYEVRAGQRLFDGVVGTVDADGLDFVPEAAASGANLQPGRTRVRLFAAGEPAPHGLDPKRYTGAPMSIDVDADVTTFAMLMGEFSGLNVVLEAGTKGPVRIAARNAPWDGVFERGLNAGGFDIRLDGSYVRVGRRDRMEKVLPASIQSTGHPITLSFRNADMRDLARLFADISGLAVDLPPRDSYEPVTVLLKDVPWDAAFALIMASHGWTFRLDGDRLRVEAP